MPGNIDPGKVSGPTTRDAGAAVLVTGRSATGFDFEIVAELRIGLVTDPVSLFLGTEAGSGRDLVISGVVIALAACVRSVLQLIINEPQKVNADIKYNRNRKEWVKEMKLKLTANFYNLKV